MELIIAIICIIICCLIAYSAGKKNAEKQEKINNDQVLQERNNILKEIEEKRQESNRIDQEYHSKLQIIREAKNAAESAFEIKNEQLQKDFDLKKQELVSQYTNEKQAIQSAIDVLQTELASLKATRAAAIEAVRQEEKLIEEQDSYRLTISDQDARDIAILNSIKLQVSKPRLLSMLIWQTYYQPIAKQKFPLILGSKEVCGIYKITNMKDGLIYIGQAVDIRERWNQHAKHGLSIDTPQGNKLYQAMIKDGLENFTFQLLEECPREELNKKEAYYIGMYNSCEFGYNSNTGIKGGT